MTIPNRSSGFRSSLRILVFILVVSGWLFSNSAWASIVNEPMTGMSSPGWVIGGSAYLTASTGVDTAGDGWLRITEPLTNQSGFAFFDSPFDISTGVVIQFDYATWGGNGADGYSVFLFDGSYDAMTFAPGASGGSLGYDKKTVAPLHSGLTGGYIGIGIDEYGNFSNPSEGRLGGPGQQVNEVGVRGPYNHPSGAYYWLGGSGAIAGNQLAFNNQFYRPIQYSSQYRKVVIKLTPVPAPNYLQVDTYIQFGYNQPVTPVITGLFTGRPIPASVKIGYAASTGGSTNYHEIRNLLIDPLQTDIDLAITKLVSNPSVTANGQINYTITAKNYGPANTTAVNVPIDDTFPALVTGVTWTCTGSGGGVCGSASGTGTINIASAGTATLPFNGSVTYTVRGTVSGSATPGTQIMNTASLTVPAVITDYNSGNNSASVLATVTGATVSVSGFVFNDANHNGTLDGGETAANTGSNYYAKLFRSSNMITALQAVLVTAGSYTFVNVPSYENYTIILSTNNSLIDPTPLFTAQWVDTNPLNFTLSNVIVGGSSVSSQNFGVYHGSRIFGRVINDNGYNGAPSNANDGVLNAAETGVSGVTVWLTNNTGGTTYDTTTTDSGGTFMLFTNTASKTLRVYETNPAGYLSVNANVGSTGGAYTMGPPEYIQFTYTLYNKYNGIIFGDIQDNVFSPSSLTQIGSSPSLVYFGHVFTPGSGGTVSFVVSSQTQTWLKTLYKDVNCNGSYDAGDIALPASFIASVGTPLCILVKETIPAGITLGITDQIVTRATFVFTNSIGPLTGTYNVTDTTTVALSGPSTTVSGMVYNDANHSGIRDAGENSPNLAGIYAKLFRSSNLVSALSITSVDQAAGTYTFNLVPTNDTYTIILSTTNNTAFDPSFPSTQWIYTSPVNYTLSGVAVGSSNLTNQNFGVLNGTRIDGLALKDDGAAVGANANNGVQNAGETGLSGMNVSICDDSSCTSIDTATTDANGAYSLYVPWGTNFTKARVTETTIPAGYSMVNYNPGSAVGSGVNLGSRDVTFTFTRGTEITGLVLSNVPDNILSPSSLALSGGQLAQLYYAHTFSPGSGGMVSFAVNSRSQPTWPAVVLYQDVDCSGIYNAGDIALPGSISATAGTPICILVKDTVLSSAPTGTIDQIVTRATFTFTNSSGPVVNAYTVTDTTTVQTPNLSTSTKTWTDLSGGPGGGNVNPGDVLQYTITLINSSSTVTAFGAQVTDTISTNLSSLLVVSIPSGAADFSTATTLDIRSITVPASGSVTIVFNATVSAMSGSIANTANITLPVGAGPAVSSTTATIVSLIGNKPLYFYGGASSPYLMSRTPSSAVAPNTTAITIASAASAVWSLQTQPLRKDVTITANVPLTLYLRSLAGNNNTNHTAAATLNCSASWGANAFTGTTTRTLFSAATTTMNVTLTSAALPRTCTAGNYLTLTITNNSSAGRSILVYPVDTTLGNSISKTVLPVSTVITVNSVNAYLATYPSTSTPASGNYAGGQTVYLRPVVSDPFGSFDISSAAITIKDPNNNTLVSAATLTNIVSSTSGTNTYEYAYTVPGAGPGGIWTYSITAKEGTENTVSDTGVGTFLVQLLPNIMVVKSASVISDPINGVSASAKAIPGAEIQYTIQVINNGGGVADADSIVVSDVVPANTTMYVDTAGIAVTFSCSSCGLTTPWTYANAVSYSYQSGGGPPYVYPPTTIGYDPLVKGVRIKPSGTLNGGGASFTVMFKMQIN